MDKRLWVTGYRSYEIGVFSQNDPKLVVIKKALSDYLVSLLDNGKLNWVITGGQMGTEQWAIEIVSNLRNQFPDVKVSMMTPFTDFGLNWNENNQELLNFHRTLTDFSDSVSNNPYQNPQQLRNYQNFMLEHTDSALLLYDPENEGKTKFDLEAIKKYQDINPEYSFELIDMEKLTETADSIEEQKRDDWL